MSEVEAFFNEVNSFGGAKRRRATKKSPRRRPVMKSPSRVVYLPRRPTFEEEVAEMVLRDKLYRPVVKKVYKKPAPSPAPSPAASTTIGGKKKRSPKKK